MRSLRAGWTLLLTSVLLCGAASPAAADTIGGERLAAPGVVVASGVPAPPEVEAQAYVVADATTGQVLAAKNAHQRLRPASTLKTLTALTALPHVTPEQVYTATQEDAAVIGSKVGLVPGAMYTVDDLYNALFLRSGNDAATALAEAAGGVPNVLNEMNERARELHALDTKAVNPTGLDEEGQYTSAYDLALFGRAALREPVLRGYMGKTSAVFPGKMPKPGKPRDTFELWTQQKYVLNYDGAIGVKNGYTTQARFTGIMAAERDGRTVLVSVMKTSPDYWHEAASLSDWAFKHTDEADEVGTLVEPTPKPAPETAPDGALAAKVVAAVLPSGKDGPGALGQAGRLAGLLAVTVALLRARVLLRRRRLARHRFASPAVGSGRRAVGRGGA